MVNEIKVVTYNDLVVIKTLIPNWLFFFLGNNKEAIKNMYTCVCHRNSSTIQRCAWCGFDYDMDHCCNSKLYDTSSCNYDANQKEHWAFAESTQNYAYYIFALLCT